MVRSIRKAYIICILQTVVFCAVQEEELFLRANKYYTDKDYDSALETYSMIDKKSSAVLYNMGNCYFHKHNYAYALVYWLRAESDANCYEYSCIQRNKKVALKKLGKQKELGWWQYVVEFFRSKFPAVSLLIVQLIFLLCWMIVVFGLWKQCRGYYKVLRGVVYFCMVMCALIVGLEYAKCDTHTAIVVKKDRKLFAGPDKSFHELSPVFYADSAIVKETRDGWHKIQYADILGWVESDVVQII